MAPKKMVKKHLITYSVILVMVTISLFNICSVMGSKKSGARVFKSSPHKQFQAFKTIKFFPKNIIAPDDYSFANESMPINEAFVKGKLQHTLLKDNFKNVQSNILQTKAGEIFPLIVPILKAYGIPDDFKYIPLVETGLRQGTSARGAKGIWQFMPGTARNYGLKVGSGIDERMNIRKSTIAACKYIKELYAEFNSWTLAAAAYNNGSIKMERAINAQNEDNYFMMHLNGETGAYVYKLIAMKEIISQPDKYGYKTILRPSELFAFN